MHNGKTISLQSVLWEVMENPLANELTIDIAAEYAVRGLQLLGAPFTYIEKVTDPYIRTKNYKAELPHDLVQIKAVRLIQEEQYPERSAVALRYATDDFHHSKVKNTTEEFTYKVQEGIIFTSIPEACLEISYQALPVDKDGYPLIPDNPKVIEALRYYILFRYLQPLYLVGKVTDKAYETINQEKSFYMAAASNDLKYQGIDHIESIMNTVNRLIVNVNNHKLNFKNAGEKERFRRYR